MSNRSSSLAPSDIGAIEQPPCRPPLEIIEQNGEWLVREYRLKPQAATVFDTHHGRLDAMRAAREKMQTDRHPCLLRWDDTDLVGGLYWNELFEELRVEYSDLLEGWVIVPASDHYLFQAGDSLEPVCQTARAVQRQYDFKRLAVYDTDGTERDSFEHRFIRHDIAASGVHFDRDQPLGAGEATDESGDDATATTDTGDVSAASPASTLMAAIPDLTELGELNTSGPVFRYRATWDDGQLARIDLLDPDLASNRAVVRQFTSIIDNWQSLSDHDHVTTVYEVGPSPAAWIAYSAAEGSVADLAASLSRDARLQIIADVAAAIDTARRHDVARIGIAPESVLITSRDNPVRASLAGWGLDHAVAAALGDTVVTPYTAPEQLSEEWAATTPIYQLGALAYRLLCHMAPFNDADDLEGAIREGVLTEPTALADVPAAVDSVLRRAMAPTPAQRYTTATTVSDKLTTIFS